ncbi:ribonuclease D [soil metagenome]
MAEFRYVATPAQLDALVEKLRDQERLALDTEFMRERTYYPILCLIQVASADGIALVDSLAIEDLSPLGALFGDPRTTKVLHAGRQDLEILLTRSGTLPRPLFDTQVAAALLGHGPQVSYAMLVETLLDVRLSKSHTRTNWVRRPLDSDQLSYAADDVRYLFELEARLRVDLESLGRAGWAADEHEAMLDENLYRPAPHEAWRRFKGLNGLSAQARTVARELAAWREHQAMMDDRPRQWVMRDHVLLELASAAPRDEAELAAIVDVPDAIRRRHTPVLLEIINRQRALQTGGGAPRLNPAQKKLLAILAHEVRTRAAELGLHPELLATRRELERCVRGESDAGMLHGWRREVIGERMLELVARSSTPATTKQGSAPLF